MNGRTLNGRTLNGRTLNGSDLGSDILWTSALDVQLHDTTLDRVDLRGSELVATSEDDDVVSGKQMRGARFDGLSDTGNPLTLRIAQVDRPAQGSDIWSYWVEYQETDGSWVPICIDLDTLEVLPATALAGYWNLDQGVPGGGAKIEDPDKLTFACPRLGAIGKCITAGYRPWAEVGGVSLDRHHQTCVRTLRADYCGDGTPYTMNGQPVNIYDALGVQVDTEDWAAEAEWDPDGARCVAQDNRSIETVPCFDQLATPDCADTAHFDGTLIISETPPL